MKKKGTKLVLIRDQFMCVCLIIVLSLIEYYYFGISS